MLRSAFLCNMSPLGVLRTAGPSGNQEARGSWENKPINRGHIRPPLVIRKDEDGSIMRIHNGPKHGQMWRIHNVRLNAKDRVRSRRAD